MYKYLLFIVLLSLIVACQSDSRSKARAKDEYKHTFTLEGVLKDGNDKSLLVQEMQTTTFITIDTLALDSAGAFKYKNTLIFPTFYALKNESGDQIILLPNESESIFISGDYYFNNFELKGSPDSEAIAELHFKTRQFLNEVAVISAITRDSINSPDYAKIRMQLLSDYDSVFNELREYSINFIERYASSPLIILALNNQTGPGTFVFDPVMDMEIFIRADSLLYYLYPDFPPVKNLHDKINVIRTQVSGKNFKDRDININ